MSAALTAACAPLVGGSPRATWHAVRTYGADHPSPNAGRIEAAFAGALGVKLGGPVAYNGHVEVRPPLGDGRPPDTEDVRRASRLSLAVGAAAAALAAVARSRVLARRRMLARSGGPARCGGPARSGGPARRSRRS
jgi:adenosylcobinamide-phosphate synthase